MEVVYSATSQPAISNLKAIVGVKDTHESVELATKVRLGALPRDSTNMKITTTGKGAKPTRTILWGSGHVLQCECCFEMERRGYNDEEDYWCDFFNNNLKPIKYKIIKGWGKDKGREFKYAEA